MSEIPFTFGIITNADNGVNEHVPQVVESIHALNIPEYQILIVGHAQNLFSRFGHDPKIAIIGFDEKVQPMWITRKKNLITKAASFDNIVYLHDYIVFEKDWYEGFKLFGNDFKACITKVKNKDGERFRDWVIFPWHECHGGRLVNETRRLWEFAGITNNESMLPYDENRFVHLQYFSGSYWIAKKTVMLEVPLNEGLVWEQGEDLDWSLRFSQKYKFSMNKYSTVQFLKQKTDAFHLMTQTCYEKLKNFY